MIGIHARVGNNAVQNFVYEIILCYHVLYKDWHLPKYPRVIFSKMISSTALTQGSVNQPYH
jgi:hypothetical protein